MKRLTVYLKNQKKQVSDGKEKTFNVRSFHNVSEKESARITNSFKQEDVVRTELVNY